jgi:hypothetical protein
MTNNLQPTCKQKQFGTVNQDKCRTYAKQAACKRTDKTATTRLYHPFAAWHKMPADVLSDAKRELVFVLSNSAQHTNKLLPSDVRECRCQSAACNTPPPIQTKNTAHSNPNSLRKAAVK